MWSNPRFPNRTQGTLFWQVLPLLKLNPLAQIGRNFVLEKQNIKKVTKIYRAGGWTEGRSRHHPMGYGMPRVVETKSFVSNPLGG